MADFDVEDLVKQAKIVATNELIEEGLASGVGTLSLAEIRQAALDRLRVEDEIPNQE